MDSLKRKHEDASPPAIYSNKSRSRAPVEARVDPTYGQRSALPYLDDETSSREEEQELNYDDDGLGAIEYLKAVRQEANGIPNLLVAPNPHPSLEEDIYNDGVGDFRGWYEDGAYVASDIRAPSSDLHEEDQTSNLQAQYYRSILSRYERLRTQLQQTPPHELIEALDSAHPNQVGTFNMKTAKWWIWNMKNSSPHPVQVASMDKSTVLRLLGLLSQGTVLKGGLRVEIGVSRWVWSLLARLPDRGALNSEEIGVVRDLGKKAVMVGVALKQRKDWAAGIRQLEAGMDGEAEEQEETSNVVNEDEIALDEEYEEHEDHKSNVMQVEDEDDSGVWDGVSDAPTSNPQLADILTQEGQSTGQQDTDTTDSSIPVQQSVPQSSTKTLPATPDSAEMEAIKASLLERLAPEPTSAPEPSSTLPPEDSTSWNTQATVDMILTIAGEAYGQRDLLEFRGDWGGP